MKVYALSDVYSEDPFKFIFEKINSINPKNIILAGGETPIPLYANYFKSIASKCVISDERITAKKESKNQENIMKYIPKLEYINFPNVDDITDINKTQLQESYIKYEGADLCILGMGLDGHYASIFPHMDINYTCNKGMFIYCTNQITGENRFSLTPSFLEQSQNIFFILKGNEKIEQLLTFLSSHDESVPIVSFFKYNLAKITLFLIN